MSDVVGGMVQKIRSKYPKEQYAVYTESVEQGLKEPCFFVFQILQNQIDALDNRYKSNSAYVIQYLPGKRNARASCKETAQELYELLEYISDGSSVFRGVNMRHEIRDGVLHFFVEYNYYILRPKGKEPYMEEVKVYGKTTKRNEKY